ncbi:acyl-CoA dehydrogenase family protein [Mycobacteroides chelonae]|uniref:acyl-CoA dehydrogenase family protein n=1 Tax=Mycobacteroides chelonae TaxID=1774 RepID=UPI0004AB99FF|nr:acyl-CoA dehydrogenase family protein [Mycobacteroides chelonae]MBF9318995.1 acyl-CoA dehydrogenase [Mycobacteroides chelonae]OHT70334.1 acyl-CoA dehydrogenase [Mycobacteroides chelonae]OHT71268.1 acyl-CoA dehydrogenase [Mycobacteroides chelonae]OHT85771.1 acyl-CoA dehydrogenase [Mycobacteroides chelonae]
MTADLVRRWLHAGELALPMPGAGHTAARWWKLAALTQHDVTAGRLAEAHCDAMAILCELDGPVPGPEQLWGVWAAEAPNTMVTVAQRDGDCVLDGTKAWCSGAGSCTHALITARREDNARGLYAVDMSQPEATALPQIWQNVGMRESDTRSVQLSGAIGIPVGRPGRYLDRPGFWHGAMGVAACWLGGARGVAAPLYRAVAEGHRGSSDDPHAQAHLGAVDAALAAAEAILMTAAAYVDAEPHSERTELIARRVRAVVEHAVDQAIVRTGRALGPGPLALDARHAQHVADLTMYVRQSHAERDLAALGRAAAR